MGKIDKTKDNIKVNNLSSDSRKMLFNKFVEAGGKITSDDKSSAITQKSGKSGTISGKDKNTGPGYRQDAGRQQTKGKKTATVRPVNKKPESGKQGFLASLSQKLYIQFRLYMMKVTDFSASDFNIKFLHQFSTEYKTALMGIRLLYIEIFKRDQDLEYRIIDKLEKTNPFIANLIGEIPGIYNAAEIDRIAEQYINSAGKTLNINTLKEPLLSTFSKIYVFKPYEHMLFSTLEKSIEYYVSITKKKSSEYSLKRKNLKNDIYIIFEKLFPALYWLFCKYQNRIIPPGTAEIEEILQIKPINMRKKRSVATVKEENTGTPEPEKQDKTEETEKKTEEEKPSLDILSRFVPENINELRTVYDRSNIYNHVRNNDKMLYIFLIFQEFDSEYSFLLTTNKIKYKLNYTESGNINYKDKFLELYNKIKNNFDLLKEYADVFDILFKVHDEKPLSNDRYVAYSKELTALTKRRQQSANSAKYSILSYMSELSTILYSLISDINGPRRIVDNPYDVITFDVPSDKNKKLNNRKILEALMMAYNFTIAFVYRMNKGDLSGELEFSEQKTSVQRADTADTDKQKSGQPSVKIEEKIQAPPENTAGKTNSPEADTSALNKGNDSIIDELDDIAGK